MISNSGGEREDEAVFLPGSSLSERVIFPSSSIESNGIEDARFVEFEPNAGQLLITRPKPRMMGSPFGRGYCKLTILSSLE